MDIIFDIDRTLADLSHRLHYIQSTPKDWDAFFDAVSDDALIEHTAAIFRTLRKEHRLVCITGRPERTADATSNWLIKHDVLPSMTYFRTNGDFRDVAIVKGDIFDRLHQDGYKPKLAFDDQDQVIRIWRNLGVSSFKVML